MGLIVGTDLYGRVKKVEGISVVTTFGMLQFLPLYPISVVLPDRDRTDQVRGGPVNSEFRVRCI